MTRQIVKQITRQPAPPSTRLQINASARSMVGAAAAMLALAAVGCASTDTRTLTAAEFAGGPASRAQSSNRAPARPTTIESLEIISIGDRSDEIRQAGAIGAMSASTGAPTLDPLATANSGAVLVDGKVGDINGQAVFARAFFQDQQLEGRLRAEAQRFSKDDRQGFRNAAAPIIFQAVRDFVENEVIYREKRFSLSEEQEFGLRAAIRLFADQLEGRSFGSRQILEQRLQEEQGLTLDQFLDRVEREQLISEQIKEAVAGFDEPSFHEVRAFYLNNQDIFNPDPRATVRMIWLSGDENELAAILASKLEEGESFESVASDPENRFNAAQGGLLSAEPIEFKAPLSEAILTPIEPLNAALTSLDEGGWAGPIPFQTSSGRDLLGFVSLDSILQRRIPFVDAQLTIYQQLRQQKTLIAKNRYINRLLGGSSYTGIEDMTNRLLQIAEETYLGPDPDQG